MDGDPAAPAPAAAPPPPPPPPQPDAAPRGAADPASLLATLLANVPAAPSGGAADPAAPAARASAPPNLGAAFEATCAAAHHVIGALVAAEELRCSAQGAGHETPRLAALKDMQAKFAAMNQPDTARLNDIMRIMIDLPPP